MQEVMKLSLEELEAMGALAPVHRQALEAWFPTGAPCPLSLQIVLTEAMALAKVRLGKPVH
jgi:hypothetical protein